MSTVTPVASSSINVVETPLTRERVFIGFYHFKASRPHERQFYHKGDLASARDRFYQHCTIMGYRFISVRPFIVDLEIIEASRDDYNYVESL